MSFPFAEVEKAIAGFCSKLGCRVDRLLQDEYDAGLHPNLLAYAEKLQPSGQPWRMLDRYLIGATSYLHQPSNHYDIFGACRSVIVIQLLDAALNVLQAKQIKGLAGRVGRLVQAVSPDAFDSVVFELIAAGQYAALSEVDRLEFVDEQPPKKTPDMFLSAGGVESFVECKKLARVKDFNVATRLAVRELLNRVISSYQKQGTSILAEVVFIAEPKNVSQAYLMDACQAALQERTVIVTAQFTVKATELPKFEGNGRILYPSPYFFWTRYGYRVRAEWFGIVHQVVGNRARRAGLPKHLQGGVSSWFDTIEWDAGIKWKIGTNDILARYRRFGFDSVFDAIKQINNAGSNSTIHLWLESDYFMGRRRDALLDLFNRLSASAAHAIGWIVINETLLDVSPKGRFDLVEQSHMIRGPTATTPHPWVSGVFGLPSPTTAIGEFGVGHDLPDIDDD